MKREILSITLVALFLMMALTSFGQSANQHGPLVDELKYVKIVDPSAAVAALLAREIDICEIATQADLETVLNEGFRVVKWEAYALSQIFFNLGRSPISDIRFRRAIAHLIPKESVLEDIIGPFGKYEHNYLAKTMMWYNPDIPDVTEFDPELAAYLLDQAGYVMGPGGLRIDPATGNPLRELQLVTLIEFPEGDQAFLERWEDELEAIGIPARIEYTSFSGGQWYIKIMIERDFDAFMISWAWYWDPTILEWLFASYGPLNIPGYNNTEFDEKCYIMTHTIDEIEAKLAAYRMQEILVNDVPAITLYTPVVHFATHPDLIGVLGKPFFGFSHALLRWRWKTEGGTIRYRIPTDPESLIHGWDMSGVAWDITWRTCDFLLDMHPFTMELMPWIVTDWKVEEWSDPSLGVINGMKITLWVRDDLYWHDGIKFTAHDLEFAAKYAKDYDIPRMSDITKDLIDAKAISETRVEFYYNRTSIFVLFQLTVEPYLTSYPKHLYNPNATRYGPPEGPMNLQIAGKPGVPYPSTFVAPSVPHPNPPADKPWLTCFIGVGPWILKSYEWGIGATFIANKNYFLKVVIADVNYDRCVDIFDCVFLAISFGSKPGDPNWNEHADINGDQIVDIFDMVIVALSFGETY